MLSEQQRHDLGVAGIRLRDAATLHAAVTHALDMAEQIDEGNSSGVREWLANAEHKAATFEFQSQELFYDLLRQAVTH